jgi:hypothetical protein
MSTIGGAVLWAGRTGRGCCRRPAADARGLGAPPPGIVWLLWLPVAGIAAFAAARGMGVAHALQEASLVAVFAPAAAHPGIGRRARSAAAVLGLITASAVIVDLSGGWSRPTSTSS